MGKVCQLPVASCQLSIVNCQWFVARCQLQLTATTDHGQRKGEPALAKRIVKKCRD
ncbi:hypothetical protein QUF80_15100 [Desulfococcaceae bacterium HSG8]|nr:hypothetical protein [Desulfococcaceae bacterium HSG8]